jgi:subtilisin family serine protease
VRRPGLRHSLSLLVVSVVAASVAAGATRPAPPTARGARAALASTAAKTPRKRVVRTIANKRLARTAGEERASRSTRTQAAPPPAPVIVAVIDGGVDVTHPDLQGHLWVNPGEVPGNGVDDDGDGIVDDVNGANFLSHDGNVTDESGHGTHVSGIVLHYDPSAKIMALKAGHGEWIDIAAATQAVDYAVAHGARVINLSWAFLSSDPGLAAALANAEAHGVLVVAAAGNFGFDSSLRPVYPASYSSDSLLSVAATCDGSSLASFSNFSKLGVSLAAPGCDVVSSLPGGAHGPLSGTSMASPAVAGTAALLLDHDPQATPHDLVQALLGGAQPAAQLAPVVSSGASLSVPGALQALAAPDTTPPAAFHALAPATSFATERDPSLYYTNVTFSWTPSSDAALAGYRVLVGGAPIAAVAAGATSVTAKVPPGQHTWSVVAYDRSDNTTASS